MPFPLHPHGCLTLDVGVPYLVDILAEIVNEKYPGYPVHDFFDYIYNSELKKKCAEIAEKRVAQIEEKRKIVLDILENIPNQELSEIENNLWESEKFLNPRHEEIKTKVMKKLEKIIDEYLAKNYNLFSR